MTFYRGQKVVCVNDDRDPTGATHPHLVIVPKPKPRATP